MESINFKVSVMALRDSTTKEKIGYHEQDNIFNLDIGGVLLALGSDSELYNNQTKEQLQKSLTKLREFYLNVFEQDFKFYCENVINKFVGGLK